MHVFKLTMFLSFILYGLLIDYRLFIIQISIYGLYFIGSEKRYKKKTSTRKKMAFSTWDKPDDPSFYSNLDLDCEIIDDFIIQHNRSHPDSKITYKHFFLKIIGLSMKKCRKLNGTWSFGQFVPFDRVDISLLNETPGRPQNPILFHSCDQLSLVDISQRAQEAVKESRIEENRLFDFGLRIAKFLPTPVISFFLHVISFISYQIGWDIKSLNVDKFNYGNVVLTDMSSMEFYNGHYPLINISNAVLMVAIFKPKKKVVVCQNRDLKVKKVIRVSLTLDNRFGDATDLNPFVKEFYAVAKNPSRIKCF